MDIQIDLVNSFKMLDSRLNHISLLYNLKSIFHKMHVKYTNKLSFLDIYFAYWSFWGVLVVVIGLFVDLVQSSLIFVSVEQCCM